MSPRILILSGPTHEYIDPVRYIGNASSGLMGKALAEEALRLGHKITFISGPVSPNHLPNLGKNGVVHRVTDAAEMLIKAEELFPLSDIIIFAAAVADYTPIEKKTEKMAKSSENLLLKLKATADIAKTLCRKKRTDQIAIGFALQTAEAQKNARRKLENKKLDGIVLNSPTSLGAESGTFSFLCASNPDFVVWGNISKARCATHIFQALEDISRGK
jgi:phosphopantothenoylcysteine decarboxylase/phosphopantothenate--cysteine ligase